MKSNMWKSTFREIKQSFGRFMAIFAIIALGVSLFAGLKVLQPAMVKTTDTYYKEKSFYNYRLLSTLGYEQEDVDFLAAQEDVRYAEGIVSFDILCNVGERNGIVLKAYNMPESVNALEVISGRFPENSKECIVDSAVFPEEVIGQKVILSGDNEEDDLEKFSYQEFEIVGRVQSPNYIQFERGNTSLGNGQIVGFMYLPIEAFDVDYFTEILIKFDEDHVIYSDAYKSYMEEKEPVWEQLTAQASEARYQRIVEDAQSELADAKNEFEEEKRKAEAELEDARIELEKGKSELQDAKKELDNARAELENGRKDWEAGKERLEDGRWELWGAEKDLADGEVQLNLLETQLAENRQQVEKSIAEVAKGRKELEEGQAELNAKKAQVDEQIVQVETQKSEVESQITRLEESKAQIATQRAEIEKQKAELLEAYGQIPPEQEAVFAAALEQLAVAEAEIDAGLVQLEAGRGQLESALAQLEEGKKQLDVGQEEIDRQRAQLDAADEELTQALQDISAGETQIAEARKEIKAGKKELKDAWETFSENEGELLKGEQEILDGEAKIADGQRELSKGWQEYNDGFAEYEKGYQEFLTEIAEAEQEIAEAEQEIADIERPESFVLGRETNVGYVCFENDSAIVDGIANVFPIFFYAVAALVCITTMNRMVEEQRTQIGVLKALGYSKMSIMGKYLFYSGAASITGSLFGYFFGTWFFPKVIWFAYGSMYDVADIHYVFDGGILLFSLIVSVVCSVGTTYLTCRKELSEVAAELMRPKAPKAGKRVLLERIPWIWNRMKFLHKVSYRNVFRYKKRFFMMVIGISGCTGLLVTGFGVQDSIGNIANDQYGRIQVYDINVMLSEEMTAEMESKIDQVLGERETESIVLMEKTVDLIVGDSIKSVNLIAIDGEDDLSPFVALPDANRQVLTYPKEGECILTDKLAQNFGLHVGDSVTFSDENNHTMTLMLSGIAENYLNNYVYMTTQTYEKYLGENAVEKSIYINVQENVDKHQVTADLMRIDGVASASVASDAKERFTSMIESLDLLVVVIILCAAFLAFIVLYNLTNINITERIREIATIKVLGFHKKETAAYIFRENLILTFFGALAGMLLGKLFHGFVMSQIQVDQVSFAVRILPISYLYSMLITFVFAFGVNLFMRGKLDKINMTESLKSVD